jgi:hypothetical protein
MSGTATTYTDTVPDSYISGNAQIELNRDQPPVITTPANPGAIFSHQDRAWVFLNVQNTVTNNQPQCQLWYSNFGRPWEFNAAEQVLLVGSEDIAALPTGGASPNYSTALDDSPVAGTSLSTVAVLWKRRTMWSVLGEDQSDYTVYKLGDYGCISRRSVTKAFGSVYWLSEEGPMQYNGAAPNYIGEKVRNFINSIPIAYQQEAVGFFANRTWYLSFPSPFSQQAVTLAYYTPTGQWFPLGFATQSATFVPANPTGGASTGSGEIFAMRPGTTYIDRWFCEETDLGSPINGSWVSPISDSGEAWAEKEYRYITVLAPIQPGVTCTYGLTVDMGAESPTQTFQGSFDLGTGQIRHIASVPSSINRGFTAQLTLELFNTSSAVYPQPAIVWFAGVHGIVTRSLVQQS